MGKDKQICSQPGCHKKHLSRGLCSTHYQRAKADGSLANAPRRHFFGDPESAFKLRTEWRGDCLIWTGSRSRYGYGQITVSGRVLMAHRYAWEREHGPIPEGKLIDHRLHCDPACVNVKHLRLATRSQNNSHQNGPRSDNKATGIRNVYPTRSGKYRVTIGHQGKQIWLGVHDTIEAAVKVAESARQQIFGEFAGRG